MRSTPIMLLLLSACGVDPAGEEPIFPASYATTYREVRDCRLSLDHDLKYVRILASPEAFDAYDGRLLPFEPGAMLVKEQYEDDDRTCEGPVVALTAMRKLPEGTDPEKLDWEWQRTNAKRVVDTEYDTQRCARCHEDCGGPPYGYLDTCAAP